MFGPFSAGDSLRVYRLQRKGVSLDLQHALTQPASPLREAWLSFLTQQAMGRPTFVLSDLRDGEGVIQVRYRPHQAAADVTFLAPALSEGGRAAQIWVRLLEGTSTEAAERGIQRIFASVPGQGAEVEIFHQVGFTPYSKEDVYRRDGDPPDGPPPDLPTLRPRQPDDWPMIQKLCVAVTPQRVRQAEGGITLSLGRTRHCRWYVLPGASGSDLAAALSLCAGEEGHWLRLLVHPNAPPGTGDDLVHWGLTKLAEAAVKPVYCPVRQYEGGLRPALEANGFALDGERTLMVKQTVALAKAPAQDLVTALAGSAEVAPPVYHVNRYERKRI